MSAPGTQPRCECCDLPLSSCGLTAERRLRQEAAELRRRVLADPRYFPASLPGRCVACGEEIAPGDPIRWSEPDGWVCACEVTP